MLLPVLSALLVLLLAAGRCSVLEPVSWSLKTRTETERGLTGPGDRESQTHAGLEAPIRDPQHKEKFIKHLTGPLSFNPKCRKHFHRLYHNTRDCTIPAYYKRCARLLTRLANSPRCSGR